MGRPKIKTDKPVQIRPKAETRTALECVVAKVQGEDMTRFIEAAVMEKIAREHPDCLPSAPPDPNPSPAE